MIGVRGYVVTGTNQAYERHKW